jgi:hypothetical protein
MGSKPKIYKSRARPSYWICHSGVTQGYGDMPEETYKSWHRRIFAFYAGFYPTYEAAASMLSWATLGI